jgi:hypothetical protein
MFGRRFELQAKGQTIARMTITGFFTPRAKAESEDGCWIFQPAGFWNPEIEVRECEKELPMARYERNAFGTRGTLRLSKGRVLVFRLNLWRIKAECETESGEPLCSLKVRGLVRYRAIVTVHEKCQRYPEAQWIPHFLWFLVLYEKSRRAA